MTIQGAFAGTYSVIGVDWFPVGSPGTATESGFIRFGLTSLSENPLDIRYGIDHEVISGPSGGFSGVTGNPVVAGMWKWKVRWVGAPGEAHPVDVIAIAQYKGTATCVASASSLSATATALARSEIDDPIFYASAAADSPDHMGTPYSETNDSAANGSHTTYIKAANFVLVSGNTWDGESLNSVNTQAVFSAQGHGTLAGPPSHPIFAPDAWASAGGNLDVTVRLTFVDGQRVQPDL